MQIRAALAVGLPADEADRSGNPDAGPEGEGVLVRGRSLPGDTARRYTYDSSGYMTRNGLGSLEVGAFRDRASD